jgi:hypothetical protein
MPISVNINMPEPQKQGWVDWMLGRKAETPDEAKKRADKEAADKRAAENIRKAIAGGKILKKVVKDAEASNAKAKK